MIFEILRCEQGNDGDWSLLKITNKVLSFARKCFIANNNCKILVQGFIEIHLKCYTCFYFLLQSITEIVKLLNYNSKCN